MNSFKSSSLLLLIVLLSVSCIGQPSDNSISRELKNLTAFSKLYGYVKYFHPSDEAREINWDKLAILGVQKVKKVENDQELKRILQELFLPIAPTITITTDKPSSSSFLTTYLKSIDRDTTKLKTVAWQHLGVDIKQKSEVYTSSRVNRNDQETKPANTLFQQYPKVGETAIRQLAKNLWSKVPLALYSIGTHTQPKSAETDLNNIQKELESIETDTTITDNENIWLADIIIAWNELQHFYPYFDVVNTDWERQLSKTLKKTLADDTPTEFFATFRSMLAATQDGHIGLYQPTLSDKGGLPFLVDWIDGKVVVTHSMHEKIDPGDIIKTVNEKPATETVQEQQKLIAGSSQLSLHRSLRKLGTGDIGTKATVEIKNEQGLQTYTVQRSSRRSIIKIGESHLQPTGQIEEDIYYVDLTRASMEQINNEIDKIASSPGVIFDMRGYPNANHQVIRHLLADPDTSDRWMQIPKIIYPDQKNIIDYQKQGWKLKPAKPHIQGEVVFITDARAVSYAESVMSLIAHYNLGEIVGQPTGGVNGNANQLKLPAGFRFWWTGMKVVKHDGSQHHLRGVKPTIRAKKTIKGVREGRDEYLEKAIQVLQ